MLRPVLMMNVLPLVLLACSAAVLKGYVGSPVQSAYADLGQPHSITNLPDGTRAYTFYVDDPDELTLTPSGRLVFSQRPEDAFRDTVRTTSTRHANGVVSRTTIWNGTGRPPVSEDDEDFDGCFYTFLAAQRGGRWVITGYREPSVGCSL